MIIRQLRTGPIVLDGLLKKSSVKRLMLYSLMYSKAMSAPCRPACGRAWPASSMTTNSAALVAKPAEIWLVEFEGSRPSVVSAIGVRSLARSPLAVVAVERTPNLRAWKGR